MSNESAKTGVSIKAAPVRTSMKSLSKDEVLRIWTLRAAGARNRDIASELNCAEYVTSDVVRGHGPQVPVPPGIRKAVQEKIARQRGNRKAKVKPEVKLEVCITTSIPAFLEACIRMKTAELECLSAGVTADTLNLLRVAAEEQVSGRS